MWKIYSLNQAKRIGNFLSIFFLISRFSLIFLNNKVMKLSELKEVKTKKFSIWISIIEIFCFLFSLTTFFFCDEEKISSAYFEDFSFMNFFLVVWSDDDNLKLTIFAMMKKKMNCVSTQQEKKWNSIIILNTLAALLFILEIVFFLVVVHRFFAAFKPQKFFFHLAYHHLHRLPFFFMNENGKIWRKIENSFPFLFLLSCRLSYKK